MTIVMVENVCIIIDYLAGALHGRRKEMAGIQFSLMVNWYLVLSCVLYQLIYIFTVSMIIPVYGIPN